MNTRVDRVLIEYTNVFANVLDKAYRIINEAPDQIIQHNISVQHIDSHIQVFHSAIKSTLARMDLQSSLLFVEYFNEELSKLKDPSLAPTIPVENRLAEVKILSETINQKVNQYEQPGA